MSNIDNNPAGGLGLLEQIDLAAQSTNGWAVLLFNDPVNLMDYVTGVLMDVCKVSKDKAENLMLIAHMDGKVPVYEGGKEECQTIVEKLGSYQLWASLTKVGA